MTDSEANDRRALHDAMVEAFPTYADLEQFCAYRLDLPLQATVGPCGVAQAVFELLRHLQAEGREPELLDALVEERAGHPGVAAAVARLRDASGAPPPQLPRLQRFLGRDAERDELASHVVAGGGVAVCLRGAPGAGKSTLALAVLDEPRVVARFRGRRWFVRLDGIRSGAAIWGAVRQAMGLPAGPVARDAVMAALGRGGVLVLDNGETPWDNDPEGTAAALRELGTLRDVALLLTIRGDRELPFEVNWRRQDVEGLPPAAARRLFEDISGWPCRSEVEAAINALAYLPLAVALLAEVARRVGAKEALHRWGTRRSGALSVSGSAAEPRHRDWLAVLGTAFAGPRVGDGAHVLARSLAELPDGIAYDDLTPLGGDCAHDDAAQLIEAGLAFRGASDGGRLRMLQPVREGARVLLGDYEAHLTKVTEYYLSLLETLAAQIFNDGGREALDRLSPEQGNLVAAIQKTAEAGQWTTACKAVASIAQLDRATGGGDPAWLEAVLRGDPDPLRRERVDGVFRLGMLAFARSDHESARRMYEEARLLYVKIENVLGQADCIQKLGNLSLQRSDHDAARRLYEEARSLYIKVSSVLGEANCIGSLGDIAFERSEYEEAWRLYERARVLYVSIAFVDGEAHCVQRLGNVALRRSDHEAARRLYEEARPRFVAVGDALGEARCAQMLGDIAVQRSDHEAARRLYEEARPLYVRVGFAVGEANCIRGLGDIALQRSDHDAARRLYEEARSLYIKVSSVLGEANCIGSLGDIAFERSEYEEAWRLYERARVLYVSIGSVDGEAHCVERLGNVALRRSDHEAARRLYEEARPRFVAVGDALGEARCAQMLGDIAVQRSDHEAARTFFMQALTLYRRIAEPYSTGWALQRLARLAPAPERARFVAEARASWNSIDRPDLVADLDREFPP